ncbi:hypothetical protein [Mangrovibacterium sp.]|uniref:hypothetical protein n=1 Tax=Mangrovibacterium sp. TaxID=1961364 RepID=UPI003568D7DB
MFRNVKILSWLVVILLATNLATIATVFYHTRQNHLAQTIKAEPEVQGDYRTRFFNEQLGLSSEQLIPFRDANRKFNRKARGITENMSELRTEMLNELFSDSVDIEKLQEIARGVGNRHEQLKMATCDLYIELKSICNDQQKAELAVIFQSMLNSDERVNLPGKQRRNGKRNQ